MCEPTWAAIPGLHGKTLRSIGGGGKGFAGAIEVDHGATPTTRHRLFVWGAKRFCGLNETSPDEFFSTPQEMPAESLGGDDVCAVDFGLAHTMAFTINGDVYAWGSADQYQCANEPRDLDSPNEITPDVPSDELCPYLIHSKTLKKLVPLQVCCGSQHSMMLAWDPTKYLDPDPEEDPEEDEIMAAPIEEERAAAAAAAEERQNANGSLYPDLDDVVRSERSKKRRREQLPRPEVNFEEQEDGYEEDGDERGGGPYEDEAMFEEGDYEEMDVDGPVGGEEDGFPFRLRNSGWKRRFDGLSVGGGSSPPLKKRKKMLFNPKEMKAAVEGLKKLDNKVFEDRDSDIEELEMVDPK